ncbi:MAG TPA: DUF3224 domain-containing protein [Pseudonocardia sp.]
MMNTLETALKIESWDEEPVEEHADGTKISQSVARLGGGDEISSATSRLLLFYRPDGTSSFAGVMRVVATLDGRPGAFVLSGGGTYDGTTAAQRMTIVDASGSGELAGIRGSARSDSTHADYPNMPLVLEYDLG